ncbi:SHOCT domain-containing protein [Bacillus swezeyi]|uniref:SHOCT domain-containing protein n=1 Tax=Bacillus swezeyi TaxID=1925020 RepID=UPI0039C69EC0
MAFLLENGEVYNCQFKKRMKASKKFIKNFEAIKITLDGRNETILEAVGGNLKHPETPSLPFGLLILTENLVYFGFFKKKELILKEWTFDSIAKITTSGNAILGYKIDIKTYDEEFTLSNITEGDQQAFGKHVESKIAGNEEKYLNQQENLKKDIKEYYFKSNKTTVTLDDDYVRVARKGVINAINRGFSGEKSYRLSELSGVQIKKPGLVTSGYFQFLTPAANETKGLWDATQDDNTFNFTASELPMAQELQKQIEKRQSTPVKPSEPAAPISNTSAADELKKYKELLDMDAITQEEYDTKKKQLLNL